MSARMMAESSNLHRVSYEDKSLQTDKVSFIVLFSVPAVPLNKYLFIEPTNDKSLESDNSAFWHDRVEFVQ